MNKINDLNVYNSYANIFFMENNKIMVVRSDGGICSQIEFTALGNHFKELGYIVKYDLSWFKEFGLDLTNTYARNFDMHKAFPAIQISEATDEEICIAKKNNLYRGGYPPERIYFLLQNLEFFRNEFEPIDLEEISNLISYIKENYVCAIHVRRTDILLVEHIYGKVCDVDYYLKAMDIADKLSDKKLTFMFFSDDMQWVIENIIPCIEQKYNYKLCNQNGSDKGYLDLYLISLCPYIIGSNGSFASFAKMLSKINPVLISPIYREWQFNNFDNIVLISRDMHDVSVPKKYLPQEKEKKHALDIIKKCIPEPVKILIRKCLKL